MELASTIRELSFTSIPNANSWRQILHDQPEWLLVKLEDGGSEALVRPVLECDALATLVPVHDAIHEVNDDGLAVRIVDRETLAYLGFPQLVRTQALVEALEAVSHDVIVNPALEILRHGGIVLPF